MGLFLKDCDWVITQNLGREVLRNSSVSIDDNGLGTTKLSIAAVRH
jgi:hypothetical protein